MLSDRNPPPPRSAPAAPGGIVCLVIALALVGYGLVSRAAQNSRLSDLTKEQAVQTVAVVTPSKVENQAGMDLPGRLEAFIRAPSTHASRAI